MRTKSVTYFVVVVVVLGLIGLGFVLTHKSTPSTSTPSTTAPASSGPAGPTPTVSNATFNTSYSTMKY